MLDRSEALYENGIVGAPLPHSASIGPLAWVQATYDTLRIPHYTEVVAFLDDTRVWVVNTDASVPWMAGLVEQFGTAPFSDFIICTFRRGEAVVEIDAACDCGYCSPALA